MATCHNNIINLKVLLLTLFHHEFHLNGIYLNIYRCHHPVATTIQKWMVE